MNIFWVRTLGVFGILGGLILFAGDMLLYYNPNTTNLTENMGNTSDSRIIWSTVTALLAAWFYTLGVFQVYFAFKPTTSIIKNIVVLGLGAITISYGVVHGEYVAIATSAKLALQNNIELNEAVALASEANNILRLMVYPIFGFVSLVFIVQVWKKKTLYPRWIVLFFPLVPFLLQGLICKNLSGSAWIIVCGGYLNLILAVFFTASTIALWNKKVISGE